MVDHQVTARIDTALILDCIARHNSLLEEMGRLKSELNVSSQELKNAVGSYDSALVERERLVKEERREFSALLEKTKLVLEENAIVALKFDDLPISPPIATHLIPHGKGPVVPWSTAHPVAFKGGSKPETKSG